MAVVNEYVCDADVERHDLLALRKKWKGDIPPSFRHTWTVDRNRDSYFIPMQIGGTKEYLNRLRGVPYYRGVHWDVATRHESGSSDEYSDRPFRIVWGPVHIKHPGGDPVPHDELVPVLKDALAAYGERGVVRQIPHTVVTFAFQRVR